MKPREVKRLVRGHTEIHGGGGLRHRAAWFWPLNHHMYRGVMLGSHGVFRDQEVADQVHAALSAARGMSSCKNTQNCSCPSPFAGF